MGIRDKPFAAGSPWQNSFAERLIRTIRHECVDHMVVLGEAHLRRRLQEYVRYYNIMRTHQSSEQDTPVFRPVQKIGRIVSHALVGGLPIRPDLGFRHTQHGPSQAVRQGKTREYRLGRRDNGFR
jgi:hypothetical protein